MQVPRRSEVAGYVARRRVPYDSINEAAEHEELHRLLREATRLIESADLRGASETLGKVSEIASLRDLPYPAFPSGRSGHTKVNETLNDTRQRR